MQIVDLRQVNSRSLEVLFEEEAERWLRELHWDYRPSLDLVRKFIDSHSLAGSVAFADGQPAGYGFYVIEDHKGLIGGLFASSHFSQLRIAEGVLKEMFWALKSTPRIERIEAQLMPFGEPFDPILAALNLRLHRRQFMLLSLASAQLLGARLSDGLRLEPWSDRVFEPCARLIRLAYADHVDSEINDQYRSEAGGLKFLRNIVILPGCGQFLPEASFVVCPWTEGQPVGMVLASIVAGGVAHITQLCVMPGYQGNGLGRHMMEASIQALRERHFRSLSLTVTSLNAPAVRLYEGLGFKTIKTFSAGFWVP